MGAPRWLSMIASSSSVNFTPLAPKNLMPLSAAGLCEAVITTPSRAADSRTARATAGVGKTPSEIGSAPAARNPRTTAASSATPDPRVSRPIKTVTTPPPDTPRAQLAAAWARRAANSSLITGPPYSPRTPSVPKYFRLMNDKIPASPRFSSAPLPRAEVRAPVQYPRGRSRPCRQSTSPLRR